MENKDNSIHIWHDNSGSDNYDLFFNVETSNDSPPSTIKLHCHEDEANYKERWQLELSSMASVQQLVNTERDRAVARENQIEGELNNCCQEVKGRLDTAEQHIAQNQTTIQGLQTDVQNVQSEVATAQQAVNTERDRAVAKETQIENKLDSCCQEVKGRLDAVEGNVQHLQTDVTALGGRVNTNETNIAQLQHDVQNALNTANTSNTTAQQAQTTANAVNSVAQQTTNDMHNLQNQLQQSNQTITDLQTQLQAMNGVWNYIPYFLLINDTVDGLHVEVRHDLTNWINSFPDPSQIEDKLKNGRYRLFINKITDQGKAVTAYINDYHYVEATKTLHIEYTSTNSVVMGVTLMTN